MNDLKVAFMYVHKILRNFRVPQMVDRDICKSLIHHPNFVIMEIIA